MAGANAGKIQHFMKALRSLKPGNRNISTTCSRQQSKNCQYTCDGSPIPGPDAAKCVDDCEKVCMPCCPKARYPPDCYFPFEKPKCKIIAAPRPAFSECAKDDFPPPVELCDCCPAKPPPCFLLPKKKDTDIC